MKKGKRGSVSLQTALVAGVFTFMFLWAFATIGEISRDNDIMRRGKLLSSNHMMRYDDYLFEEFGLTAYFDESVGDLSEKQFPLADYPALTISKVDEKRMFEGDSFEKQVKAILAARYPLSLAESSDPIADFVEGGGELESDGKNAEDDAKRLEELQEEARERESGSGGSLGTGEKAGGNGSSKGKTSGGGVTKKSKPSSRGASPSANVKAADSGVLDKALIAEYMVGVLTDRVASEKRETSLYDTGGHSSFHTSSQVEYIVTGSESEKGAMNGVYMRIMAIRTGVNLVRIRTDSDKMRSIRIAAATISLASKGSIKPVVAEAGLIGAMAIAMTKLDMDSLLRGEGVPTIQKVRDGKKSSFETYYDDYLRVLLAATPRSKVVERFKRVVGECARLDAGREIRLEDGIVAHAIVIDEMGREKVRVEDGYYE